MERKGDWMQTATGKAFWPMDPRPEDVDIDDIAHALSNICRFTGHCRDFYSVAQHSVLVSQEVPEEMKLWGLLHDASEAYLCDVPRPIKPFLTNYKEIERQVTAVICERFGLEGEMPGEVGRVDAAILADEARCLMAEPPRDWCLIEPPLGINIVPWPPDVAKNAFITTWEQLTG